MSLDRPPASRKPRAVLPFAHNNEALLQEFGDGDGSGHEDSDQSSDRRDASGSVEHIFDRTRGTRSRDTLSRRDTTVLTRAGGRRRASRADGQSLSALVLNRVVALASGVRDGARDQSGARSVRVRVSVNPGSGDREGDFADGAARARSRDTDGGGGGTSASTVAEDGVSGRRTRNRDLDGGRGEDNTRSTLVEGGEKRGSRATRR